MNDTKNDLIASRTQIPVNTPEQEREDSQPFETKPHPEVEIENEQLHQIEQEMGVMKSVSTIVGGLF